MPPMKTGRMWPYDPEALTVLREHMVDHLAKLAAAHQIFTAYRCNHCRILNPVKCPRPDQVEEGKGFWDSTTTCLACGRHNFVCVFPNGRASATEIGGDPENMDDHTSYLHPPVQFEIIAHVTTSQ